MSQKTLIRCFSKQNFTKIPNLSTNIQGGKVKKSRNSNNFTLIKKLGQCFTILLLICCTCVCGYPQEVIINLKPKTEQQIIGKATKTSQWVNVAKKQYFLYKGGKGSLFYVKQGKNGNFYRVYIKSY